MEKYSRFRDESTGIAPFQEARPPKAGLFKTAALFVLGMLTYPICLLNLIVYFLVVKPLFPAILSRQFLRWSVLLSFRVPYVFFAYEGAHRVSVRQKLLRKAQAGDVLLSNFTSPLDPLIYESKHKVVFVLPTLDRQFEQVPTFRMMKRALSTYQSPEGTSLREISHNAAKLGAFVVVFVEGTPTNGRGLLTLKNLGKVEVDSDVYAAALRYTPSSATAPVPSALLGFIFRLLIGSGTYLASIRVASQPMAASELDQTGISKAISAVGRLRILGDKLDVKAKEEYEITRKKRA